MDTSGELETGVFFLDASGRSVLLRGVNLSAGKTPRNTPSHVDAFDEAEAGRVSFVGTPLDLSDGSADVHLARLRGYGFNVLRYVVCWEALEHAGPGKYDNEYIEYTGQVLKRCHAFGFRVFIDPHQDLFSRFSGGCGAPIWAVHACGLNPRNFGKTLAAILHSDWPIDAAKDNGQGEQDFPQMLWTTNHNRFAVMTLDTLFFAGKDYAPKAIIDGMNIQDWLQSHYIAAFQHLAKAITLAGLNDTCVFGYDSINEPDPGFIGATDLSALEKSQSAKMGPTPTYLEGMRLAMGHKVEVDCWKMGKTGPHRTGKVMVDPGGEKAWLESEMEQWGWKRDPGWELGKCIWAQHGVWDINSGDLLVPNYFAIPREALVSRVVSNSPTSTSHHQARETIDETLSGNTTATPLRQRQDLQSQHWPTVPHKNTHSAKEVDPDSGGKMHVNFVDRYWADHSTKWTHAVREVHPRAIVFLQPSVFAPPPSASLLSSAHIGDGRAAYSPHFYDGLTIMHRHWHRRWNADVVGILRGDYITPALGLRVGKRNVQNLIAKELAALKEDTKQYIGDLPTLIGETGIPMDLDEGAAFDPESKMYRDFSEQVEALDALMSGCDASLLNYTIWGYNPFNSHERGDNWNREDLSIWSQDDVYDGPKSWTETELSQVIDSTGSTAPAPAPAPDTAVDQFLTQGARGLQAFCRPYPLATAGVPTRLSFSIETSVMELEVRVPPRPRGRSSDEGEGGDAGTGVTDVYVPYVHYRASNPQPQSRESVSPGEGPPQKSEATPMGTEFVDRLANCALEHFLDIGETLALDIDVSEGACKVVGQLLKWRYQYPAEGEPEKVVTMRLSRRGGALPVKAK